MSVASVLLREMGTGGSHASPTFGPPLTPRLSHLLQERSMMTTHLAERVRRAAALVALAVTAGACSDAVGANANSLSLSVSGKSPSAPVASRAGVFGPSLDVVVGSGANSITITKAQIVLGRIEVEPGATTSACSGTESDGCPELKLDPVLVDLPLDGTTKTDFGASIPAGSYRGVELKVRPVSSSDPGGAAFLAANPSFSNVSVHVEGTYNGQPFSYNSSLDVGIEMELSTPITLTSGSGSNLTLFIDVASWFADSSGNAIDPTNSQNASTIDNQIKQSFNVFEDDDRNGVPDTH